MGFFYLILGFFVYVDPLFFPFHSMLFCHHQLPIKEMSFYRNHSDGRLGGVPFWVGRAGGIGSNEEKKGGRGFLLLSLTFLGGHLFFYPPPPHLCTRCTSIFFFCTSTCEHWTHVEQRTRSCQEFLSELLSSLSTSQPQIKADGISFLQRGGGGGPNGTIGRFVCSANMCFYLGLHSLFDKGPS